MAAVTLPSVGSGLLTHLRACLALDRLPLREAFFGAMSLNPYLANGSQKQTPSLAI
jgi:hypothetical protein